MHSVICLVFISGARFLRSWVRIPLLPCLSFCQCQRWMGGHTCHCNKARGRLLPLLGQLVANSTCAQRWAFPFWFPFQTTIQLSVASTLTTTIANPNPDIVPLTTQHHISATPDTPQRTHGSHRQAANGTVGRALPTDTASPRRSTRTARTPKTERTTAVKTRDTTATTDNAKTYECRHRGVATVPSSI